MSSDDQSVEGAVDGSVGQFASKQDVRDLNGLIRQLRSDLRETREELEKERRERENLEEAVDELRQQVSDLDDRTDLLKLTQSTDEIDGERMQVALIQHLYEEATHREEQLGKRPVAEIGKQEASRALQFPEVSRSTIYTWMRRAADRVDGKVLQYDDGKLKINLTAGDLDAVSEREVFQ